MEKCIWASATLTHAALYLSAGSVGMSVRSAVNAVLTELVRSLSRALAAVLWRPSPGGGDPGGPSLPIMVPTSTPGPAIPAHSFLFLFILMWKADGDEEDRRKAAELEELVVRSSEPDPSLPFSSSSSERRAMSPYKKRPVGGAVRSMANVIFTATRLWQLLVNPCEVSTCWGLKVASRKSLSKFRLSMLLTKSSHPLLLYPQLLCFAKFVKPGESDDDAELEFKRSASWSLVSSQEQLVLRAAESQVAAGSRSLLFFSLGLYENTSHPKGDFFFQLILGQKPNLKWHVEAKWLLTCPLFLLLTSFLPLCFYICLFQSQ